MKDIDVLISAGLDLKQLNSANTTADYAKQVQGKVTSTVNSLIPNDARQFNIRSVFPKQYSNVFVTRKGTKRGHKYSELCKLLNAPGNAVKNATELLEFVQGNRNFCDLPEDAQTFAVIVFVAEVGRYYGSNNPNYFKSMIEKFLNITVTMKEFNLSDLNQMFPASCVGDEDGEYDETKLNRDDVIRYARDFYNANKEKLECLMLQNIIRHIKSIYNKQGVNVSSNQIIEIVRPWFRIQELEL